MSASLSPNKGSSGPSPGSGATRKHASKACEPCRKRRVKCRGGVPCEPCVFNGTASQCEFRSKARPKRMSSSKAGPSNGHLSPKISPADHLISLPNIAGPSEEKPLLPPLSDDPPFAAFDYSEPTLDPGTNPIIAIDNAMLIWCFENNVPFDRLLFTQQERLSGLVATPLPAFPAIVKFEDDLMSHFVTHGSSGRYRRELKMMGRPRLLSLYGRYRDVPNSLSDDQKALVYVSLCLARHTELVVNSTGDTPAADYGGRQDVTYYRLAREKLKQWGRPSVMALWTMSGMVSYIQAIGGPAESAEVCKMMADTVRELGVHKLSTAPWYTPEDMVQVMFSAYLYMDVLRGSMTDLSTFLPLDEIEIDPTPPAVFIRDTHCQASAATVKFFADFANEKVDIQSEEYVRESEARWEASLMAIRKESREEEDPFGHAWAVVRYHWLRLLLHFPRRHKSSVSNALTSRALAQIICICADMVSAGLLSPAWLQVRRTALCAYVLVLQTASGEMCKAEAHYLFKMAVDVLNDMSPCWPEIPTIIDTIKLAASRLNLVIDPPAPRNPRSEANMEIQARLWGDFTIDFDPATLFVMTHEELQDTIVPP